MTRGQVVRKSIISDYLLGTGKKLNLFLRRSWQPSIVLWHYQLDYWPPNGDKASVYPLGEPVANIARTSAIRYYVFANKKMVDPSLEIR